MRSISFIIVIVLATLGITHSQSKQADITFTETIYDFGKIKEDAGKVIHKFEFANIGGNNLLIARVQASCGCTSPEWTQNPVMPGGKGYITATFDPSGRPGKFDKSLTVYSNAKESPILLRITGEVVSPQKSLAEIYPRIMGSLRLKTNHVTMAKISSTEVKTQTLDIVNTSQNPVKISFAMVPDHITIRAFPEVLKPEQEGKLIVTYDAKRKNDWDYVFDRVYLIFNDEKLNPEYVLTVSASIEEDFKKLTPKELATAPKINFVQTTYDFDNVSEGDVVEYEYKFTNTGKSDLVIRKTKASCGCTAISPSKDKIAPGESAWIKVKFDTSGKEGNQSKSITVVSNDPTQSVVRLWINGKVEARQ